MMESVSEKTIVAPALKSRVYRVLEDDVRIFGNGQGLNSIKKGMPVTKIDPKLNDPSTLSLLEDIRSADENRDESNQRLSESFKSYIETYLNECVFFPRSSASGFCISASKKRYGLTAIIDGSTTLPIEILSDDGKLILPIEPRVEFYLDKRAILAKAYFTVQFSQEQEENFRHVYPFFRIAEMLNKATRGEKGNHLFYDDDPELSGMSRLCFAPLHQYKQISLSLVELYKSLDLHKLKDLGELRAMHVHLQVDLDRIKRDKEEYITLNGSRIRFTQDIEQLMRTNIDLCNSQFTKKLMELI